MGFCLKLPKALEFQRGLKVRSLKDFGGVGLLRKWFLTCLQRERREVGLIILETEEDANYPSCS